MPDPVRNELEMNDNVSSLAQERIGVVFLHHRADPVTLRNLESFREWNPDLTIVTMTSDERIEGGYSIQDDETISQVWREQTVGHEPDRKQRLGDLLLYGWYRNRREQCDRWLVVEWDCFCAMSVREFIEPVAAYPFVAATVVYQHQQPGWPWFGTVKTLPARLQPFAMGAAPCAFVILKDEALDALVKLVPWETMGKANSEVRLGTLANAAGFPAVPHPEAGGKIGWQPLPLMHPIPPGMWHPIKYLVPPTGSTEPPRYLDPPPPADVDQASVSTPPAVPAHSRVPSTSRKPLLKWIALAVVGLLLNGTGLSLLGDAVLQKITHPNLILPWFLEGTVALALVNAGICCVVEAAVKKMKKKK
jgi:hypothetical protein